MPRRIKNQSARRAHFIAEWRNYRNLTQEELAEAIATSAATISRIESGKQPYTQDVLELIAAALNCEPADLIEREPTSDAAKIWSLWQDAKPRERRQLVELAKTLIKIDPE